MLEINQLKDKALGGIRAARQLVSFLPPEFSRHRRELTNQRILSSLRKLGVATNSEVKLLQSRIAKLESELRSLRGTDKASTKKE